MQLIAESLYFLFILQRFHYFSLYTLTPRVHALSPLVSIRAFLFCFSMRTLLSVCVSTESCLPLTHQSAGVVDLAPPPYTSLLLPIFFLTHSLLYDSLTLSYIIKLSVPAVSLSS